MDTGTPSPGGRQRWCWISLSLWFFICMTREMYLSIPTEELNRRKLRQMTPMLYRHIYQKYDELEKEGVNAMVEEGLILDIDVIELKHKKELRKN